MCRTPGCGNEVFIKKRGWCRPCYMRWYHAEHADIGVFGNRRTHTPKPDIQREVRECVCGTTFEAKHRDHRYCSPQCRRADRPSSSPPPTPRSRTRKSWEAMMRRCSDPRHPRWKHYGGRGITVCDRWRDSLAAFISDMGYRPEGTSIDRINVDGDYQPDNCRWATRSEQEANKRR